MFPTGLPSPVNVHFCTSSPIKGLYCRHPYAQLQPEEGRQREQIPGAALHVCHAVCPECSHDSKIPLSSLCSLPRNLQWNSHRSPSSGKIQFFQTDLPLVTSTRASSPQTGSISVSQMHPGFPLSHLGSNHCLATMSFSSLSDGAALASLKSELLDKASPGILANSTLSPSPELLSYVLSSVICCLVRLCVSMPQPDWENLGVGTVSCFLFMFVSPAGLHSALQELSSSVGCKGRNEEVSE